MPEEESSKKSVSDRFFERLIDALRKRKDPDGALRRGLRKLRRWFVRLNIAYAVILLLVLGLLEFWGDSGIILSVLLYLPAWGWILPSLALLPLCLLIHWRWAFLHVAIIPFVLFGYMDYERNGPAENPSGIMVMSYNHGQRNRTSMSGVVEKMDPAIICLQDAEHREGKYNARYPGMHFAQHGELLLISRYPIVTHQVVLRDHNELPVAARYELRVDGAAVIVYNVHLPTPRKELARLRSSKLFGLLPSRKLLSSANRERYRDFLDDKHQLAQQVVALAAQEKQPTIVLGDFNTPPHGRVYRAVAGELTDAFEEKGNGYGFTFPGNANRIYSFYQPWLRLDYVFCNDSWLVEEFHTEEKRKSQHRAVLARLRLKND